MRIFYKILHFLIVVICLLLQITFFEHLKLFSLNFDLLMVVVIAVTLFDGLLWGLLFGFIAGLTLDLAVGNIVGISAFVYSLNAFIAYRLVTKELGYKLLNYVFIVFLITETNILIISLLRYLFNYNSNLLRIGIEMIVAPACNIILMFIIFPIVRAGMMEDIELGFK